MDPGLKRLQDEISAAIHGLSTEELNWRPTDKWSVAQIVEHLYLTYTGTSKGFSRVLDAGKPAANGSTLRQRLSALVVVGVGYFPRGVKSPPVAMPRGLPPEKCCSEIGSKIAEMDEMMTRCAERFGADTKVLDHPVLGPLSVSQWRKFHLVHGRHHVKQIRSLRRQSKRCES